MLDVRRQLVAVRPRRLVDATLVAMLAVQTLVVVLPLLPAVANPLAARNVAACCLACSLARSLATAAVQNRPADVTAVVLILVVVLRLLPVVVTVAVLILVVVLLLLPAVVNQLVDAAKVVAGCWANCLLARSLAAAAVQNRPADATAVVQLLADVLRNRLADAVRVVHRQHLLLRHADAERALSLAQLLSTRHRLLNQLPLNRFLPILRLPFREVFAFDKHLTRFASVANSKEISSNLVWDCSK